MEVEERIIAMVALKEATRISPAAVAERVKTMFPWLAKSVGTPPEQPEGNDTFIIPANKTITDLNRESTFVHVPVLRARHLPWSIANGDL
jgi:hypothetical protein